MRRFSSLCFATTMLLGMAASAEASLILNGDFEEWPDPTSAPTDWTPSSTVVSNQAVGLDGVGNSLQLNPDTSTFTQEFGAMDSFVLSYDFATEEPTASDSRSLNISLRAVGGSTVISNVRVNGVGDLQMYDGANWTTVPGAAGIVSFSDFGADDLSVYRVTHSGVVNTNDISTLSQSISLFDVTNNVSLLSNVDVSTLWQTVPTTESVGRISLSGASNISASYRVDNFTLAVPEPHAFGLLALGALGLGIVRARQRR